MTENNVTPQQPTRYEFAFDKVTTLEELCLILSSIGITLDQTFVDTHPALADFISEIK